MDRTARPSGRIPTAAQAQVHPQRGGQTMRRALVPALAALVIPVACARSGEVEPPSPPVAAGATAPLSPPGSQAASEAVAAVNALVTALRPEQRAKLSLPFDSAQRARWSNLPTGIFERRGVRLGDLSEPELAAVHALLRTVLSEEGHRKVVEIMAGDEVLRTTGTGGGGGRLTFGEDEFYIAILGEPSGAAPWMIQFGGHHLAINLTTVGRANVMTPSLPATQPARFTLDGRVVRPLGDEYDKAFTLMEALDEAQRREAVLGFEVRDLVLGAGQDGRTIQPEGLRASRLNAAQQAMLLDLAGEWVNIQNPAGAAAKMAEIRAGLADTYFAWSGSTTRGSAAYFRIQGPTVVIEYAPQGRQTPGDQGVDHVHTIYRDPTNDYGARLAGR
jgi:hypothetical protein